MASSGGQTFKKRQKEQQRLEKRQEKIAKRHGKVLPGGAPGASDETIAPSDEPIESSRDLLADLPINQAVER